MEIEESGDDEIEEVEDIENEFKVTEDISDQIDNYRKNRSCFKILCS